MLSINKVVKGTITSMEENGYGVFFIQRDKVLVKSVLPKEEVKVKITKKLKDGYVGSVLEIIKKDNSRIKSPCAIYDKCGSCHLLHCDYGRQLQLKKERIVSELKKQKLHQIKVHDVLGMEHPYAYRNKIIVGFTKDKNRKIKAGFYEEFSHNIMPFAHCLLHDEECDKIIADIVQLMEKMRIEPYEEDRKRGLLRHVLIRKGSVSGQIMVVLVVASAQFPARKNFVSALTQKHPEITTVVQNVNSRKTSVVLGNEERILYGKGFIEDTLCGYRFRISPKSFYQINHDQCEVLYEKALSLCKLTGNETLLDAYCGIGTIGMYASKFVKQVIAVELNKDAVQDAKNNAHHNGISNIRFYADDAGAFMMKTAAKKERIDVVVMDPPRSGSSKEFMDACAKLRPKQIVYISCDPTTQIRDLSYFQKLGYTTQDMYLVDMFPNTQHVETVCLLSKLHADQHIEV